MSNSAVETGFCDYLKPLAQASPAFVPTKQGTTFNFYTSGEKNTFKLPCMSFEMKDSQALGIGRASRGTLTIWIETQADDETEVVHEARCDALANWLVLDPDSATQDPPRRVDQKKVVAAAITLAGKVRIYGYAPAGAARELKDRHWISGYDFTVGFAPI